MPTDSYCWFEDRSPVPLTGDDGQLTGDLQQQTTLNYGQNTKTGLNG